MIKIKNFLKLHKKKLIGIAGLLVILLGIKSFLFKSNTNENILKLEDTTVLTKKDFRESVTENGIVKSETTSEVYAQKNLPVKEVFVKIGDKVNEGDIIATLDGSSIEQQLATRNAALSQSSKSANAQIKNAQDRLNEAIRNRNKGTNSQIVSATNALTSAYDAWQSAEKAYENYKNSLEEGYNAEINSANSSITQLENAKKSSELNLSQAKDKLYKIQSDMTNSYDMANRKDMELRNLKSRESFLTSRINEITQKIESMTNSNNNSDNRDYSYDKISEIDLKIQDLEREKLNVSEDRKLELQTTIDGLRREREELVNLANNQTNTSVEVNFVDISSLKRELEDLQRESADLKEKIATASSDKSKYESEAESYSKQIGSVNQEIDQQSLAYEVADKNLADGIKSNVNGIKLREDQLSTLRKTADDLKNSYESAVKNLDVAKIGVDDEINSLKNSLKLAQAGKDMSSGVEIKYLKEDLSKTKIKSPISGTITENNLIIGQVPSNYVAKVETLNKKIIKSQIKEYDLNNVSVGVEVEITSESLGKDKIYKGHVISINPTPIVKTGQDTSAESKYETEISIDDTDDLIKPGMNVRVKYIFKELKDVLTVPSSAVYTKNSKDFIMIYSEKEKIIKEVPIEVVAENEFESVVKGNDLKENIRAINSSDKYQSGMSVTLEATDKINEKAK